MNRRQAKKVALKHERDVGLYRWPTITAATRRLNRRRPRLMWFVDEVSHFTVEDWESAGLRIMGVDELVVSR